MLSWSATTSPCHDERSAARTPTPNTDIWRALIADRRIRARSKSGRQPSGLAAKLPDEGGKGRQLLLDEIAGGLVFQLAGLFVKLRSAIADEDFRLVEREGIEKHHCPAQVVLHPRSADRAW